MKKIYVAAVGLAISIFTFITCKPDEVDPPPPPANKPPVAKAGRDTSITLANCGTTGFLLLDGTASFDPDNYYSSLVYLWKLLSVQNISNANIANPKVAQTAISNLKAGQYNIELTVTDPGGLFAKDTVTVDVIGSTVNGYDLDITINGNYRFQNNYEDCYYYSPCRYYDLSYTEQATGSFSPIGTINFYAYEEADTATASDGHYTSFGLYNNSNSVAVYGTSSINLKKVYQSGGGSFGGTFTPMDGSALNCDPNIFKNLAPLTVTGTMNLQTYTITLNIKGKIYF